MLGKIREKMKNKKGFTMVELIVVIVIILILAAALVPQLLKYVDTANRANCQSEAATLLAQVQADWVANQAKDQTGVVVNFTDGSYEVQGITVKQNKTTAVEAGDVAKDEASFHVKDADTTGYAEEIESFVYCNGKYTAVWNAEGATKGWTLTKYTAQSD